MKRLGIACAGIALVVPGCAPQAQLPARSLDGGGAETPAFPGFAIEPYLTDLSPFSAKVDWRLRASSASRIAWGLTPACELGALELEPSVQHEARIDGLAPEQRYYYRVDGAYEQDFRTDPAAGPLRMAVIGHTHGTERFASYPDELLVARLQELRPNFVVHCGDTTWFNQVDHFRRYFFELFAPLACKLPIYVSPSNHDAGWPFPHGVDLTPFKELFRYPYPPDVRDDPLEARYAIEKNGTQLLFVCYVSPLGAGSGTREWLRERLQNDEHRFNVLVLGGANEYYDEDEFFAFLGDLPLDAVLMGDSRAPAQPWWEKNGLPVYFTGTGGDGPHPILLVEIERNYLALRQLDAAGKATRIDWIHSSHVEPAVHRLEVPAARNAGSKAAYTLRFPRLSSTEVHGLQVRVAYSGKRAGVLYAFWVPDGFQGEAGYRTQYSRVQAGDDLLTFDLQREDSATGEAFGVRTVRIVAEGVDAEEFELVEAWLF